MSPKGTIKVKPKLLHGGFRCGDDSLYEGQVLTVMDISVSGDGYLALNKDNSGLGDIDKRDTEWFKPAPPDSLQTILSLVSKLQKNV